MVVKAKGFQGLLCVIVRSWEFRELAAFEAVDPSVAMILELAVAHDRVEERFCGPSVSACISFELTRLSR